MSPLPLPLPLPLPPPPPPPLLSVTCNAQPLAGSCSPSLGNEAAIQFLPLPFSVTDEDGTDSTVFQFSITAGNEEGNFSVNSSTGVISLEQPLDRDRGPCVFNLTVAVSDGLFSTELYVSVQVVDENDNTPLPVPQDPGGEAGLFEGSVAEGSPVGTQVLTVRFTDADEGTNAALSFSLPAPAVQTAFSINSSTGELSTAAVLDYEEGDRLFNFTVFASDGGSPSNTGSATVIVMVTDINDNRPSVSVAVVAGAVYVEHGPPVRVADVSVTDLDASFPNRYAVVSIDDALDSGEVLVYTASPGERYSSADGTLVVVGALPYPELSARLSSVRYLNPSDELSPPLQRSISYAACDMLASSDLFTRLSEATQEALLHGNASSPLLPSDDAALLQTGCLQLSSSSVLLPLAEVNDRPTVVAVEPVQFQPIAEDLPLEQNPGELVLLTFGAAVSDADHTLLLDAPSFSGVAVVGFQSPIAMPEYGTLESVSACTATSVALRTDCPALQDPERCLCAEQGDVLTCADNIASDRVLFFCLHQLRTTMDVCGCPSPPQPGLPPAADISRVSASLNSSELDVSPALNSSDELEVSTSEAELLSGLVLRQGSWSVTSSAGVRSAALPPVVVLYRPVPSSVAPSSALLLPPSALLRFLPALHQFGQGEILFRAWDGSNALPIGSLGNTSDLSDTAFSLNTGVANITILPVNDPPEIYLGGPGVPDFSATLTENEQVLVASPSAIILEHDVADDLLLQRMVVMVTNSSGGCVLADYPAVSLDRLSFLNDSGLALEVGVARLGQACVTYQFEGPLSVGNWQALLRSLQLSVDNPEPSEHQRRLSFTIDDASSTSQTSVSIIDVQLVSDVCPTITLASSTGALIYTEHSGTTPLDPSLLVADGDRNARLAGATVTILNSCINCTLAASLPNPFVTATFNPSTLTLTLSGSASPLDYQTLLRGVVFEDEGDEPSLAMVTVRFTLIDAGTVTSCTDLSGDVAVVIVPVNDNAPSLYLDFPVSADYTAAFTEGEAPLAITGTVVIIDLDSAESPSYLVEVAIAAGCLPEDMLLFTSSPPGVLLSPYSPASCSLALNGSRSALEAALQFLHYTNLAGDAPSGSPRTILFTLSDPPLPPQSSSALLSVLPVNDAPVLDLDVAAEASDSFVTFQVGSTTGLPLAGPGGASVVDPDSPQLLSMLFSLTELDEQGQPLLARTDLFSEALSVDANLLLDFGLSGIFNRDSSTLVVTGAASTADYTTLLNTAVYSNSRRPPSGTTRQVSITTSDGEAESAPVVATVMFEGQLQLPVVDLNGGLSGRDTTTTYTLTGAPVAIAPAAFVSDPDGDLIVSANVSLPSSCASATLTFTTAFSDITVAPEDRGPAGLHYLVSSSSPAGRDPLVFQSILRGAAFSSPDSAQPGTCQVSVTVIDARLSQSVVVMATIVVEAFNAPPSVDLDLGLFGRDYSAVHFLGSASLTHIVSILDPDLRTELNYFNATPLGEAAGEAPLTDGTSAHGVVLGIQSHAGYLLTDPDSASLTYLQVGATHHRTITICLPIPTYKHSDGGHSICTAAQKR